MTRSSLCLAACLWLLAGCASQQWYGGALAWQKNECIKLPDMSERKRCMDSIQTSYDAYRAQRNVASPLSVTPGGGNDGVISWGGSEADKVARRP